MHVYKDLFCDEALIKRRKQILRKIKYHSGIKSIYVIALSDNSDYFDLISADMLSKKEYPVSDLDIIGLAEDYDSAVELVIKMISHFSEQYGTVMFKERLIADKKMNFTGYGRK